MAYLKFKENLRLALIQNSLSQEALAKHLGTTQATVSRWLAGIHEPDFETLLKICEFLDETPNSLLGYDNN